MKKWADLFAQWYDKEEKEMKNVKQLVADLRAEYLGITRKRDEALFALATLPLDDKEKDMLSDQVNYMDWYAKKLAERAEYALNKEREVQA
jgi:hypothetical protein